MKKESKKQNVRVNLSIDPDFYELLKENARLNYVKVATYATQQLKRSFFDTPNCNCQNPTTDEKKEN